MGTSGTITINPPHEPPPVEPPVVSLEQKIIALLERQIELLEAIHKAQRW